MSYADQLLPEFDNEMAATRTLLECVPDDKMTWQAASKLRTIGWVANHVVEISGWVEGTLTQPNWDINPPGETGYQTPSLSTRKELLESFDANVAAGRVAIAAVPEESLNDMWSLLDGESVILTMPRVAVIRSFVMNHLIHHRAHLSVYLRLNDIAVPGMYGPTGE